MTPIAPGDARALTRALVKIDSRNPTLTSGAPGERECAVFLRDVLHDWGFRTELQDAAVGRPNLIARIGTPRGGRSLMFNGHLDVVGTDGMTHAPFAAEERDGKLYGRGSADMKGGIAAMCAGAWRAAQTAIRGEIILAAVADEEYDSAGTRALVRSGIRADGAIIGEPTSLAIMPAHRGFVWLEVTIAGRAAHGSRWEIGVDAIRHAGLLLAELDRIDAEDLPLFTHPLLGRGSLHASFVSGGIGMSTYPDRCVLTLERRTIPGKSRASDFVEEVEAACERIRARRDTFVADIRVVLMQGPSDVDVNAPIVHELRHAMEEHGEAGGIEGMSAWTDAALLNEAGIPTVLFGPGDISLAHAAEEYIALDEIDRASDVFGSLASRWCF
ncbi:MAG: ArgE/DapE family deacylase [Gemmatimonadaceae bacterium]